MSSRGGLVGGRTAISAKARYGRSGILLSIALVMIVTTPAILPEGVHYLEPDRQPRFADLAVDDTGEWVPRFSQTLSGTLDEKGEERGGRVCSPDCPSGVEVDEYDLWEFVHPGRIAKWQLSDVGELGDSTTAIVEFCIGDLLIMYCTDFGIEGNQVGFMFPKSDGSNFIRISPKSSFADDDVDYTIGFVEEYWDDIGGASSSIIGLYPWTNRHFSIEDQYVCFYECHEDDGQDAYDLYSVHLYAGEDLELNIHTYPDPNRGQISAFLVGDQEPYQHIYFHDEEEWTFHLRPLSPTTYKLFILSRDSDAWDGMTYDITATLWWSSTTRDPNADYDGDGWTDFAERYDCHTDYLDAASVPPDYDSDQLCDEADTDDDNDGVADIYDDCPRSLFSGADYDGDGCKDAEDSDDDDDGVADVSDACPRGLFSGPDYDGDGCKDAEDSDDDNDGVADVSDDFPRNANEWADSDGDGIGDNEESKRERAAAQTRVFAFRAAAVAVSILYVIGVIRRLE